MSRLQTFLSGIGASRELIDLAGRRTLQQLWDECERGDLMLWLLRRMAGEPGWPTVQIVVGLCCDCAELAKEQWRGCAPANCIATARAWCRGEATVDEVKAAVDAVYATHANSWAAAAYSAYAASCAAACAAAAAVDAAAAAAAVANVGACYDAAYASTLRQCADIVRAAVPTLPEIPQEGGEA